MKVYLGDVSEGRHRDPGELVAVAQTEAVGEMSLLQTTLVDHGLQVPEHGQHVRYPGFTIIGRASTLLRSHWSSPSL